MVDGANSLKGSWLRIKAVRDISKELQKNQNSYSIESWNISGNNRVIFRHIDANLSGHPKWREENFRRLPISNKISRSIVSFIMKRQ